MQPLGRMGEEIAVLVHRAALDRRVWPQRRQRIFQARGDCQNFVGGAIIAPMEGEYGDREGHAGRSSGGP